ncbi:MAG: hypothetical protein J5795_05525 [Lachnospiraceae bacterium]|nr:hypothetical protein [Lachnospiraceae bacterium]
MKDKQREEKQKKPLTFDDIKARRHVPFGDVKKYYYLVLATAPLLLAMIYYVAFVSVALRTESAKHVPLWLLIVLALAAVAAMAGHYHRSVLGYGICAAGSLLVVLLLSVGNGGSPVALDSTSPDYGTVVQDGIKSADFWILLAKVIAVVQFALSLVFIKSVLSVNEEPELKGMNIKIDRFRKWFAEKDKPSSIGWRPTEFFMTCVCIILWMLVAQASPFLTDKYDIFALVMVLLGAVLVFIGKVHTGAICLMACFLTCCSMYQLRFSMDVPTAAAYGGAWLSLVILTIEAYRRRTAKQGGEWSLRFGSLFKVRVDGVDSANEMPAEKHSLLRALPVFGAMAVIICMLPIHEFLSAYSGSYMNQQKDNLSLFFFLPLVILVCAWGGKALGYLSSGLVAVWLLYTLRTSSPYVKGLFLFDSKEQHGAVCDALTVRMNRYTILVEGVIIAYFIVCMISAVVFARRKYERTEDRTAA